MIVPFEEYMRLKPLAIKLLYLNNDRRLPYYEETNKVGQIIRLLINE